MRDKQKADVNQIRIGNNICRNITIVDQENSPVAIISVAEIVEKKGYKVLFNIGEDD